MDVGVYREGEFDGGLFGGFAEEEANGGVPESFRRSSSASPAGKARKKEFRRDLSFQT